MPKSEIIHRAGEPVTEEIKWIVEKYFSPNEIEKLERLGGRILISIATPYKSRGQTKVNIDEDFVANLKSKKKDVKELRIILDGLSVKQLRKVCRILKEPVKSDATSEGIKREIVRSLRAEDYWRGISRNGGK